MECYIIIILIVIFIILSLVNEYIYRENFKNYLYPVKGLEKECNEGGYKPAYMPTTCVLEGKLKAYQNCKCINEEGECKICYPRIKKKKDRKAIYNPEDYRKKKKEIIKDYIGIEES